MAILDSYFDHDSIYPEKLWYKLLQNYPIDFSKYRLIRGHFGYCIHRILPRMPIYTTMLRDPVEQKISAIEHRIRDPDPRFEKKFSGKSVEDVLDYNKNDLQANTQTKFIGLDPDILKLSNYPKKFSVDSFRFGDTLHQERYEISDEELINIAEKRLSKFAFFGITEKMDESLFLLYYTFGWKPLRKEIKLNVGPNRLGKNELSKKALERIFEITSLDRELYEFGRKIFERRYTVMLQDLEKRFPQLQNERLPEKERILNMLDKHSERVIGDDSNK